ncbi:N-acetylmuramoyl-L-alanine amidase [Siminovitchia sp. FSL W7-1587]|uniref:N-acetylmuramoyl-L-alanine amidase n=1 Tax=Siminovitchia sp. FSL W7-1587 TaxID=2954699 RepID=UPI0030CE621F
MVAIKQQLASQNVINNRTFGAGNPCNFITIHETANESTGANAQSHANLQSKLNPRQASWHYQVDEKGVIQSFPDNIKCWAGGDGKGPGNTQSIHIEICVNKDGDFNKAVKNAAELVKVLMARHKIPISNVVQHNRWSRKDCPRYLRNGKKGINWGNFIAMVKGASAAKPVASKPASKPSSGYTGSSIVDYLKSIGVDSSYANRAKLAAQYGIKGYKGTEAQNLTLLNKMRAGKPAAAKPVTAKKGDQKTNSIVDYLKSIGVDSSFANRKKLALKHGIKNYAGTAAQNSLLLRKMRG